MCASIHEYVRDFSASLHVEGFTEAKRDEALSMI